MILNRILSIGFLIGIHSNVAEGAFLSPVASGPDDAVLDDLFDLHMAPFVSLPDSARLARNDKAANKIVKSHLELAGMSATKLLESYATVSPGSKYSPHLLNVECKRRMDGFQSLFKDEGIKSHFAQVDGGATALAAKENYFDDYIRDATEIQRKDACAILSTFPFSEAVDFFFGKYLFEAPRDSFRKMVKILFAVNSEPLVDNMESVHSALDVATIEGYTEIVESLLDHVSIRQGLYGRLLQRASVHGHPEVAKLLLDRGSRFDFRSGPGSVALLRAAEQGRMEVAKLLLDRGFDVNFRAVTGETALLLAVARGETEMAKLLLERGASVQISKALKRAARAGHTELVNLLLAHGANGAPSA